MKLHQQEVLSYKRYISDGEQTIKANHSSFPQPADRLEVHPRGGGADQSLPGRLQRGGSSGVASLLRRKGAGGEEEEEEGRAEERARKGL